MRYRAEPHADADQRMAPPVWTEWVWSRDGPHGPPLLRSGRAAFPHPAPTLGNDGVTAIIRRATNPPSALGVRDPALRPEHGTLGQFPSATPLPSATSAARSPRPCSARRRYYGGVRLPAPVHLRRTSVDFPERSGSSAPQTDAGPPGFRVRCSRTCLGSPTARGPATSRAHDAAGVAFRFSNSVGTPKWPRLQPRRIIFRGSIPSLCVPLSTLHPRPYERRRMTRGRCGSLRLHRMTLAVTTSHRL